MSSELFNLSIRDKSEDACPRCTTGCSAVAVSSSKGRIFVCNVCTVQIPGYKEAQPLLWCRESSRLWEELDQPEGVQKMVDVKVIWCINPRQIDYHPDFPLPKHYTRKG